MKAQFYPDGPHYIRVFNMREMAWRQVVMDCHIHKNDPEPEDWDLALKRCGLRRLSRWKNYRSGGFFESEVRRR